MGFKFQSLNIVVLVLIMAGCDTWSHIRRTDQDLMAPPKIGCIENTLQKIESIDFDNYELSKSYSLDGTTYHHNYSYRLKKLPSYGDGYDRAYVVIQTKGDQKFSYSNEFRKPGTRSVSHKESQIIKSTMDQVEEQLIKNCVLKINSTLDES